MVLLHSRFAFLFFLIFIYTEWSEAAVLQTPYLVRTKRQTAHLPCEQDNNHNYMYWYQQRRGQGLLLLYYSLGEKTAEKENVTWKSLSATRPNLKSFSLEFKDLEPRDSAVYFCASSLYYADALYFGAGTKLTVLEDGLNVTAPNVALFDPSPQEIKDKGLATLVCLVSRFYPDHLNLSWSVNGLERTNGVRTDDSPTRDSDKMYSMSSRLRLTKREWLNPQNTFKCTVHFDPTNETISKETQGQEGCGITPDSLLKSGNAGKLIYLLLITKSGFYGLFVTMLGLKVKQSTRKNLM